MNMNVKPGDKSMCHYSIIIVLAPFSHSPYLCQQITLRNCFTVNKGGLGIHIVVANRCCMAFENYLAK